MAMEDLYTLKYKNYGDKNLGEFWATWKEIVRKCGDLLGMPSMTRQLVKQLQSSNIIKDDIKVLRQKNVSDWDYDQIAQTIHQRLEDIQFDKRTDKQLEDHEKRMAKDSKGKGDKGGGGGGGGGGKGGGKSYANMTEVQKTAKTQADKLKNQAWQRAQSANSWSEPPPAAASWNNNDWSAGGWADNSTEKSRSRTPQGAWSQTAWS